MVFPARAGMSRNQYHILSRLHRFPRASGDEPSWLTTGYPLRSFSPRERG